MSQLIRILQSYRKLVDAQLIATAGAVIKGLTGNATFPAPPVDPKTLQVAADEFSAAIAAQAQGGTAATAHKNNKRDEVISILRKLARYVEDNSGSDLAAVLNTGFEVVSSSRTRSPLVRPAIVAVDFGNSTQLVVRVKSVARAKCYEVRCAAAGSGAPPDAWQSAGLFTNPRSMTVTGLTPGITYSFQVRAVGGSTGYSGWSDPVSHICG